jgi:hypothetical protein
VGIEGTFKIIFIKITEWKYRALALVQDDFINFILQDVAAGHE